MAEMQKESSPPSPAEPAKKAKSGLVGRPRKDQKTCFVSFARNLNVYLSEHKRIEFRDSVYRSESAEEIRLLREHSGFRTQFWEGKLPGGIKAKIEEQQKGLTRDANEHEVNYEQLQSGTA